MNSPRVLLIASLSTLFAFLGTGCKQHGPPLSSDSLEPPTVDCSVSSMGAARVVVTFDQNAPTAAATKAALGQRVKHLSACDGTLVQRDDGLEIIMPGVRKGDPRLESLAVTGDVWVAPWIGAAPKAGDEVKRVAAAQSLTVTEAFLTLDASQRPAVSVDLTGPSGAIFAEFTKRYVDKHLLLAIDDKALMAPLIREPITGGRIQISMGEGDEDVLAQQAHMLTLAIRGPKLPQPVTLGTVEFIAPSAP